MKQTKIFIGEEFNQRRSPENPLLYRQHATSEDQQTRDLLFWRENITVARAYSKTLTRTAKLIDFN